MITMSVPLKYLFVGHWHDLEPALSTKCIYFVQCHYHLYQWLMVHQNNLGNHPEWGEKWGDAGGELTWIWKNSPIAKSIVLAILWDLSSDTPACINRNLNHTQFI